MAVYQRKDGRWEVKVRAKGKQLVRQVDPRDGKPIRNLTHGKDVEAFLRLQRDDPPPPASITVTRLAALWWTRHLVGRGKSKKRRDAATANLKLRIDPHIGHLPAGELRRKHFEDLQTKLIGETKPGKDGKPVRAHTDASINEAFKIMVAFYNWGMKHEHVESNPAARVELLETVKRQRPLLTPEQVWDIIAGCKYDRDRALVATLAFGGLRIGEAAGLKWTDLSQEISVVRQHGPEGEKPSPKMKREGVVRMVAPLRRALEWWGASCSSEWCFPLRTRDDRPFHHEQWRLRVWRPACKAAGVEGAKPHDLRVFAGSYVASSAGGDKTVAAGVMRHANPAVSAEYYILPVDKLEQKAMRAFEKTLIAAATRPTSARGVRGR